MADVVLGQSINFFISNALLRKLDDIHGMQLTQK